MFKKYTKEDLKLILRNIYNTSGEIPVANNVKAPSSKTYQEFFGSWRNALEETFTKEELLIKKNEKTLKNIREKDNLLDIVKFRYKKLNRILTLNDFSSRWQGRIYKNFDSFNEMLKEVGLPYEENIIWTKEMLREKLVEKYNEIERVPYTTDMGYPYPSFRTYYKFYKSWEDALIDAGIDIKPYIERNESFSFRKKEDK